MAKGSWNVYTWSGSEWVADGTIYVPNADLSQPKEATLTINNLIDGSEGIVIPSTKYKEGILTFLWGDIDNTFKEKIDGYIENATLVKIETGIHSTDFIGRFLNVTPAWIVGTNPTQINLEATFKIMEGEIS